MVQLALSLVEGGGAFADPSNGPLADSNPVPEGLSKSGRLCGGILADFKARARFYASDWADGYNAKSLSASVYMFLATFCSTIALAEVARRHTSGRIGVTEYLLANCAAGAAHAVFGTQPLLILRPTGPITAVLIQLHLLCLKFEFDFWQLLAWTGACVGVYMGVVAALDLCCLIRYLTRFTHDLFACFVCTIYISDGVMGVLSRLHAGADMASGLFSLFLYAVTVTIGLTLHRAQSSTLLLPRMRAFLSDYALAIAMTACVCISYCTERVAVERIPMPDSIRPTFDTGGAGSYWTVRLFGSGVPAALPVVAAVAAVPILMLFFVDQNVSARLAQVPSLRKGSYYHSSFLLAAVVNALGPLVGLPFVTASLPHSPQFVRALTDASSECGVVRESRLAPLLVYLAIGGTLLVPSLLEAIPEGAVDGTLTFVGLTGLLAHNQFVDRLLLLVTDPALRPRSTPYSCLPVWRVHGFTLIQLLLLGTCWLVKLSPWGLAFPVVIALLVPFRTRVLPLLFTSAELALLDSAEK